MQKIDISKTKSYKFIFSALTNNYKKISSWLLYGPDIKLINDIVFLFAQRLLQGDSEDLLQITNSNIGVEEIRRVINFLSTTSSKNGYKVVIISNVANMNHNSTNAILRVLEDPPSHSIVLMVSTSLYTILETVRSRCCKLYCTSHSDDFNLNISLYKEMLKAGKNSTYFLTDSDTEEILESFQVLILRLIKARSNCFFEKEFFANEGLELSNVDCDVEHLYKKWQNALLLNKNRAASHLLEQQVSILLCNILNSEQGYDYSM